MVVKVHATLLQHLLQYRHCRNSTTVGGALHPPNSYKKATADACLCLLLVYSGPQTLVQLSRTGTGGACVFAMTGGGGGMLACQASNPHTDHSAPCGARTLCNIEG
jgi:hypothetical protein